MTIETYSVQQPAKQVKVDLEKVHAIHIRRIPARLNDKGEEVTPARVLLRVFLGEDEFADCEASDLTAAQRTSLASLAKAIATAAVTKDSRVSKVG